MPPTAVVTPSTMPTPSVLGQCDTGSVNPAFQKTPSSPSLSDEAQKALSELRQRMATVLEGNSDLKSTFEVMHGGQPDATLLRFLKAREYDAARAEKMLTDSLHWRVKNDVDNILARPLLLDKYEKVRASQQYGMTGFDHEGRPVLCVRVGLSYMDPDVKIEEYVHSHIQHNEYRDRVLLEEASRRKGSPVTTSVKIYDMSGLKLTHLGRMQMHKAVAAVDDLNYPEKSEVYYIVNAPTVFGACWKMVRPLLQQRTQRKIQVLEGNGADQLRQKMEESVLPHFVRYTSAEGLGSSRNLLALTTNPVLQDPALDCCSTKHPFHVTMLKYMMGLKEEAKSTGVPRNTSRREVSVDDVVGSGRRGAETEFGKLLEETLSKVNVSKEAP